MLAEQARRPGRIARERPCVAPGCFAALGDSFTAGTGGARGEAWADIVAAELVPALGSYFNLAVDGATSHDVLGQVRRAEALRPSLITVICGANDVLTSTRPDLDGFDVRLEEIFDRLLAIRPSTGLLTATYPTAWGFLGLGPRTRRRVGDGIEAVNETVRTLARERSIPCLEIAGHPGLDERRNFASDGLHPSPHGHREAARAVLAEVARLPGIPGGDESNQREEPAWSR